MVHKTQRQKAKIAKRLTIAIIVVGLLTYAVKEILRDTLKEWHDSLASAEAQYRTELDQSNISVQILATQQQIENLRLQDKAGRDNTHRDFSAFISQDALTAQQALADLDANFDSVSRFIDKLPTRARDLRELRDKTRQQVEKTDQQVKDMLKPKPEHDLGRFIEVKMAMVFALLAELPVLILGDAALTTARQLQEATEILIRFCSWTIYFLVFLGSGLGLYAVLTGTKTESTE